MLFEMELPECTWSQLDSMGHKNEDDGEMKGVLCVWHRLRDCYLWHAAFAPLRSSLCCPLEIPALK